MHRCRQLSCVKIPSRYVDYRATSTRPLLLDEHLEERPKAIAARNFNSGRKLVEDGRECDRKFDSAATCAPIRRVNLPTCFASRTIIPRARDIDFPAHHRLIGISYASTVRIRPVVFVTGLEIFRSNQRRRILFLSYLIPNLINLC